AFLVPHEVRSLFVADTQLPHPADGIEQYVVTRAVRAGNPRRVDIRQVVDAAVDRDAALTAAKRNFVLRYQVEVERRLDMVGVGTGRVGDAVPRLVRSDEGGIIDASRYEPAVEGGIEPT